jgi:hypothetical protein
MGYIRVGTSAGSLADVPTPFDVTYGLMDISASDAGRTQDANSTMHKNRIGQKRKISLVWKGLTSAETAQVMQAFNPEYVYVRYHDALSDSYEVRRFYVGDRSAALNQVTLGGITYKTLTFNIIEE